MLKYYINCLGFDKNTVRRFIDWADAYTYLDQEVERQIDIFKDCGNDIDVILLEGEWDEIDFDKEIHIEVGMVEFHLWVLSDSGNV